MPYCVTLFPPHLMLHLALPISIPLYFRLCPRNLPPLPTRRQTQRAHEPIFNAGFKQPTLHTIMRTHRQPAARNKQLTPPPPVRLLCFSCRGNEFFAFALRGCLSEDLGRSSPSTLRLDVRGAEKAKDVAGDAGEPEAGGDEPEFGCGWRGVGAVEGVVAGRCEGEGEDLKVN